MTRFVGSRNATESFCARTLSGLKIVTSDVQNAPPLPLRYAMPGTTHLGGSGGRWTVSVSDELTVTPLTTVSVTIRVPAVRKTCVAVWPEPWGRPSPKSQSYDVAPFSDAVKRTALPAVTSLTTNGEAST